MVINPCRGKSEPPVAHPLPPHDVRQEVHARDGGGDGGGARAGDEVDVEAVPVAEAEPALLGVGVQVDS